MGMTKASLHLDSIVEDMIKNHTGGERFFDALDDSVRKVSFVEALIGLSCRKNNYYDNKVVIVSGKFGRFFNNLHTKHVYPYDSVLVVTGGLRHGIPMDNLEHIGDYLRGKPIHFLDDSFYSGATRDAIQAELNKYDASIVHTFVVYDGSRCKQDNVHSLYRYWDSQRITIKGRE